jgi:uncharacterized protein YkwD
MAFRLRNVVAVLAFGLAATLIATWPSVPSADAAGKACRLYADTGPRKLSKQHARSAVLCLINRRRENHGLGRFERHKKLQQAAQRHSERMEGGNCFAHQCYGEASLDARVRDVGYLVGGLDSWMLAENVAWGLKDRGTPRVIVDAWMHSAPHRATILSGTLRDLGVGFADGTPSNAHANGGVYTADFGVRRR